MKLKALILDNFSKFEILFLVLVIASFVMTNILQSSGFKLELTIFSLVLIVAYFGFGFTLLGRPSRSNGLWVSVVCGVIYSISLISVAINSTDLIGKSFFLVISLSTLILLFVFLFFYEKKFEMSEIFQKGQFIRIAVFTLLILFYVLCK